METLKQKFLTAEWVLLAALQFIVMVYYGMPIRESWMDASLTATVIVLAGYGMITLVKYFRPNTKNAITILVSAWVLSVISTGVIHSILKLLPSHAEYTAWLSTTLLIRFIFVWLLMLISGIDGWLFYYMKEHQQNEEHSKESDRLMREAELSNLRQQLQPHFLFNSLNSISALTLVQPEQARKMIEQLSDFLRNTVQKEANQLVLLSEELHHLNLYLEIEKVRFSHRLLTTVETDEKVLSMKIPSLLLQPILENAIKFGLYDTTGAVEIKINARTDEKNLIINVTNPFDPETGGPQKKGTGFGLSAVKRRLALLYYRNDLLATSQVENTFTTSIKIPQPSKAE